MTSDSPTSDKLTFADVVWEDGACPVCAATEPSSPVLTGRDDVWLKEGSFTLASCGQCGLVYQTPRPSRATMRYYYEDCYSGESEAKMRGFTLDSGWSRWMHRSRVAVIEKVQPLTEGLKVLDVGASYGAFIEYARVERNIDASAIDLDPGSIEKFVNPNDIDVRCGDLLEADYPANHFDVVTLYETLEHVYDPVDTLRAVHRILKPGGLVVVEVPNWDALTRVIFGSWWLPLLLPTHLQHFSRQHLAKCAEAAGFEAVHQQALFYPAEVTVSLWIGFGRLLGRPDDADKSIFRKLMEACIGLWLVMIFVTVDVPLVFFLHLFGRSGHQTLIAQK